MSMTERGIYMTLMSRSWLDDGLSNDLGELAAFARMKRTQFERIWLNGPLHECFYQDDAGKLRNERQERERQKQAEFRRRASDNGRKGGRSNVVSSAKGSLSQPFSVVGNYVKGSLSSLSLSSTPSLSPPLGSVPPNPLPFDQWFERLKSVYPSNRVTSGHRTMTAFVDALDKAPEGPEPAFGRMLSNLANQKRGHEWRVKGMVPSLENWLADGKWEQEHSEQAPAADQLSPKTRRMLEGA